MLVEGFLRGAHAKSSLGWFGIGMAAYAALMTWLLGWPVYYEFGDKLLLVRMGIIKWKIPLEAIEAAQPSRNMASAPALSMDRVLITYQRGERRCVILVSPRDTQRFFEDLAQASPGLQIVGNQLVRVRRPTDLGVTERS
jgi:hypothetical protein